jgi:hypothetical protein
MEGKNATAQGTDQHFSLSTLISISISTASGVRTRIITTLASEEQT